MNNDIKVIAILKKRKREEIETNEEIQIVNESNEPTESLLKKRRIIIQAINNLKRKFDVVDVVEHVTTKKLKRYHTQPITFCELATDMLYFAIGNFLEIEDALKLFKLNKQLSQVLSYEVFWATRYVNDFGINQKVRFQQGEWLPIYKMTYNDVNQIKTLYEKILYAVRNNHTALIYKILYEDDFKPRYEELKYFISLVAEHCDVEILRHTMLLVNKNNPTYIPYIINIAFYEVIAKGRMDMCELLLKNKSQKPKLEDESYNKNPLHLAAEKGYVDICKLLLDNGANIEHVWNKSTVLCWATVHGQLNIVKLLLDYGAKIDLTSNDNTALYIAACNGIPSIVELLCQRGCYINHRKPLDNSTALYVAAQNGYTNVVRILIQYRANHSICRTDHLTPFHIACINGFIEIVKLLLPQSNIENIDNTGLSPLYCACVGKYYTVVEFLCQNGAVIDTTDNASPKVYTNELVDDECKRILAKYIKNN